MTKNKNKFPRINLSEQIARRDRVGDINMILRARLVSDERAEKLRAELQELAPQSEKFFKRISEAVFPVEGRASARVFDFAKLEREILKIERSHVFEVLPKKTLEGAELIFPFFDNGKYVSFRFGLPSVSVATVRFSRGKWWLVGVERKNVERRAERGIKLNLTEKAIAEYISRFTNNKQSKKG